MATAIIMSSVIGAEFHKEIDPINRHSKYSSKTFEMEISQWSHKPNSAFVRCWYEHFVNASVVTKTENSVFA